MNKFSILHISDLHRKPESFDNESLIFAIKKDIELLKENGISPPEFCIVTGDLIQGSLEDGEKSFIEIGSIFGNINKFLDIAKDNLNQSIYYNINQAFITK